MNDYNPGAGALDYSLFGLNVRSSLPLPELFPASDERNPDVIISTGPIHDTEAEEAGLNSVDGALILAVPDIGRFRISGGSDIVVDPVAGVPDRNLRLYLLGSVFGALLHQRGLLPLHANAIEIDGAAVAFMGESGAGKSTLAAWFHDRGHRIVADDVCAILFDPDGQPVTLPGLPRFRLWQKALEASGRRAAEFVRSYADDDMWNKFDIPVGAETAVSSKLPLRSIYVLERGDQLNFRLLEGVKAAEAAFAHTYRGAYVAAVKREQSHWDACIRLVRQIPIHCVTRPWSLDQLDECSQQILEHARIYMSDVGQDAYE